MEYPLGQFGLAVQVVSTLSFMLTISLLVVGGRDGKIEYYLAVAKTPVCCQHCFSHETKTQHPMDSITARPSTPTPFS